MSKNSLLPIKEIHNFITLLTLGLRIPLQTVVSTIFNTIQKDIHSVVD